jgi:serine/threonine protein kinase
MAPEQFEDAKKADPRSDIYALAATLYNMVTGELPFRARTANAVATVYKKQRANDITPPREVVPSVSVDVEAAILRGMRAKPAERFASVDDFLAALTPLPFEPAAADLPPLPDVDQPDPEDEADTSPQLDLRAKQRFPCQRSTSCRALQWTPGENWFGKLINVSESGLCLQLSRRFEPGAILTVVLDSQTSRRRSVLVRVVWVEKVSKKQWKMGCHYDQPLCDFEVRDMLS